MLLPVVAALPGCVAAALPVLASGAMAHGAAKDGRQPAAAVAPAKVEAETALAPTPEPTGNANFTERFVAAALFASDRAGAGVSAVPDPAAPMDAESVVLPCGADQPPALLVDLDPAGAALRPDDALSATPGLAPALSLARGSGVKVVWTSILDEGQAPAIRRALAASGLDLAGQDDLLLIRDPGESKTDRRNAAIEQYCFVAIMGDRPGDFDELMDYLRDPAATTPYDGLMGAGWFELPPPLSGQAAPPSEVRTDG
ncbi:hypothetical protein [Croceicoccus sediminis]|uniref:hypothetical protein n=1 Tax=Croceicoccus sediminis TaxID=2571150 RepID=UPI001181DB9B|nr:hypothetical protein [Croceicoccus sediminis]